MDALMVDATDIADVEVGDEVVLIGKQGDETINVHEVAKAGGTISYEIISRLSSRLPRIFREREKLSGKKPSAEELAEPSLAEKSD